MRFKVLLDDKEEEFEVVRRGNNLHISYGGQSFAARLIHMDGEHFVLEVEEPGPDGFIRRRRIRAAGYRDGDERQLWANGRLLNYRRLRDGQTAAVDDVAASLSASIPAVVSKILVKEGDAVKVGDKLILLESMKMIIPIQAPHDGFVAALRCSAGEAVQPGEQLVELEEAH
jgi:biotin carboxyl carrier protein